MLHVRWFNIRQLSNVEKHQIGLAEELKNITGPAEKYKSF
jgi:hypothetical protein